jgi:hypothetical protein
MKGRSNLDAGAARGLQDATDVLRAAAARAKGARFPANDDGDASMSIMKPGPARRVALADRHSIGTKIVWRGLSPDDLVMWPFPVVSSTRTISPRPI